MWDPSYYHILQHLYKFRGIYIERQSYFLAFCATLVWSSPFELVSHFGLLTSIVSSNKGFKRLFATGLKEGVQRIIRARTVYELVSCSEFWTLTVAPNKGFMRLYATAPYLTNEKGVQLIIWLRTSTVDQNKVFNPWFEFFCPYTCIYTLCYIQLCSLRAILSQGTIRILVICGIIWITIYCIPIQIRGYLFSMAIILFSIFCDSFLVDSLRACVTILIMDLDCFFK